MTGKKENRRQFVIVRPLPPLELSPNARVHFQVKARIKKGYRAGTALDALVATRSHRYLWDRATCKLVFYFAEDTTTRDVRNFEDRMKGAYDGLIDGGLIVDDNSKVLRFEETEFKVDKKRPRVEMIVTEGWE